MKECQKQQCRVHNENIFQIIHSPFRNSFNLTYQLSVQKQIDAGNIPADVEIGLDADKKKR